MNKEARRVESMSITGDARLGGGERERERERERENGKTFSTNMT